MATLTYTVSDTTHGTNTKSYTLSDADVARIIAAFKWNAAKQVDDAITDTAALLRWAQYCNDSARSFVQRVEADKQTTPALIATA